MEYFIKNNIGRIYNNTEIKSEGLYFIESLKRLSNNDIRTFIIQIKNSKNRISDVKDTIKLLHNYLNNIQLSQEEKLLIFYYTYKYHKEVLNKKIINDFPIRLLDIEFLKPNYYTGYIDDEKYYFNIIFPEDEKLLKIHNFYNICEIKQITRPKIFINFKINKLKVIMIENNRGIVDSDSKINIFSDIINILNQLSNHKIYVNFNRDNICCVDNKPQKFYLKNIDNYSINTVVNFKKQLGVLNKAINYSFPLSKYQNNNQIYDKIIKDLVSKIDF